MPHSRAFIRLDTASECNEFVKLMNSCGLIDKFILENFDGSLRVDPHSLLGVYYASAEFGKEIYLVNETNDGFIPSAIDKFRTF